MSDKIRFYELAKELGEKPKALHSTIKALGFSVKSYMSSVTTQEAEQMRRALGRPKTVDSELRPRPMRPKVRRPGTSRAKTAATPVEPTPAAEPSRAASAPVAKAVEPAASEPEPQVEIRGGRRVLRNEDGVIVGTERRSEPKILGYIKVAPRRRKKTVVQVAQEKRTETGRATRRKEREDRKRLANRRNQARERSRRRSRRVRASHTVPRRPENRVIEVNGTIVLADLAHALSKPASHLVRVAYDLGIKRLRPQHRIDVQTAQALAETFEWRVVDTSFDEATLLARVSKAKPQPRAPVVTVMGHVDHGKTSLLDAIRNTRVAKREAGGITQHIGAYRVRMEVGDLVFLDTPGHEAFNAMRARGAQVTDIVVLVVAADDGVMPTTLEAIEHAREAEVPIVVALTKVDLPDANPGRVKQQLMEHRIIGEEFGGDTLICEVSAVTGDGIDSLLEHLLLQAEVMEIEAPIPGRARGVVLESRVRKGHGPTCTVLVQAGTLRPGDVMVAGNTWGKVRRLLDEHGKRVDSAGPSTPVTVVGLDSAPSTGRPAVVVDDDDAAKRIIDHREERQRQAMRPRNVLSIEEYRRRLNARVLPLLVKADVAGSIEAIEEVLDSIEVEGVELDIVHKGLGPVTEGDVKIAAAAGATIVGFAVKSDARGASAARQHELEIVTSRVIYELADEVHSRMADMLDPVYEERALGTVEVRALFKIPRVGRVAGARVVNGEITRGAKVRVVRGGETIHEGDLGSLRVHKDDVARVGTDRECGLTVAGFADLQEGDRIEAFALEHKATNHG
ncbi:MAG: translation initiation factor IF-2 [Nannocystaceae bacterium]